ncbi:oxidoreductase-like domain-containing protein 1 [Sitodiplosis mosellana]|uniref:oxidoreductase-like domain-containing protein 1 n=1 Tax=Sitodiplosis mosellana TaxID=263140 RepID=UPI0024448C9E|nr:oxidoreductase-like domain-containing protein 1 [Sitodiplosis mosellana]
MDWEKMYSNGLLKDAISNRSICTPIRFSHDRPSNSGTSDGKTTTGQSTNAADEKIPPPPTNCCMSGCANCVWIQYAEKVSSKLQGGSDAVREIIMNEVQDTNMRSFLEMELRLHKLKETKQLNEQSTRK